MNCVRWLDCEEVWTVAMLQALSSARNRWHPVTPLRGGPVPGTQGGIQRRVLHFYPKPLQNPLWTPSTQTLSRGRIPKKKITCTSEEQQCGKIILKQGLRGSSKISQESLGQIGGKTIFFLAFPLVIAQFPSNSD